MRSVDSVNQSIFLSFSHTSQDEDRPYGIQHRVLSLLSQSFRVTCILRKPSSYLFLPVIVTGTISSLGILF